MKFQMMCLLLLVDCLITLRHINGADKFQYSDTTVEENIDNTCSSIDDKCVKHDRNPVDEKKHTYSDNTYQEEHLVLRDDADDGETKGIDIEHGETKDSKRISLHVEEGGHETIKDINEQGDSEAEFYWPPLTRIDPGSVGDVVDVELEDGTFYKRITRAVNPPIFEIPDYLSLFESRMIISAALKNGLETSGVVGGVNAELARVSQQAWVASDSVRPVLWNRLIRRLSRLTQVPIEVININEDLQVVSYVHGGHYHAHLDTTNTTDVLHLPCCFQAPECHEFDPSTTQFVECCRVCRYLTVMYYLTDVDAGGETAFPLADMSDDLLQEKLNNFEYQMWHDLSHCCYNSSVIVRPKRGTAIMWYNHHLDENGYLGLADFRSQHGGCDIIEGNKWIATHWIVGKTFRDTELPV